MIESPLYLRKEFNLSVSEADEIFGSWIETFTNGENKMKFNQQKAELLDLDYAIAKIMVEKKN